MCLYESVCESVDLPTYLPTIYLNAFINFINREDNSAYS